LTRVDHVIDGDATAEWRVIAARFGFAYPEDVTVGVVSEDFVIEVESEFAEFPELVSDVFSGVGYGSI
jgi:hypothetical protein